MRKPSLTRWGDEARALGWVGRDLFSLHPLAPLARYDEMGLVWMLGGEEVSELTEAYARTGNTRYFLARWIAKVGGVEIITTRDQPPSSRHCSSQIAASVG